MADCVVFSNSASIINKNFWPTHSFLRSRFSNFKTPHPKILMAMKENGSDKMKIPHVLTVAGSDSGGGAGIQADLKSCAARSVYCSTVITALTAQNTVGVQGVNLVPEHFVALQLKSVLSDMQVDVVKTGMLPSIGIVNVVCQSLKEYPVRALVVDPVMVSTSGDVLAGPSIISAFREYLLPMADIVTPNIKEASALLDGMLLETVADMRSAAKLIHAIGPRSVLVKGGDLPDSTDAVDVFFDGNAYHELRSSRIKTRNTHGTGCTLASCIAAELAKGSSMFSAVKAAKCYVETALEYSKDIVIGNGPQDSRMNRKWGRPMVNAVKAALEGGATIIQLREKDAETKEFLETAKACLEICHSHGVPLLINDRIDVAMACDADGVHVGQSDIPASIVRALLGPEKIIGVSCKTPEQAQQAWIDGADYIGCGGVFPTNTKANNITVGLDGLKVVCAASKLPVVAIGGIKASNAGSVMEIGVSNLKGVAVVSGLFDQESVVDETRKFHSILTQASSVVK
ncbi:Hydroxymethylpyrimidine/phosphomethylpyrimidine kinase [Euphorbia peplus]|nr:Hydroxymethylpyrimidine/phosphomethylpyrimidine kinase [Euphorbia peplus]